MAGEALAGRPARHALVDALDAAAAEASEALVELRRLARGIHPAIVSERALAAARVVGRAVPDPGRGTPQRG